MTFQTVEQLQVPIATLTAENERLQTLVKDAYEDGWSGGSENEAEVCYGYRNAGLNYYWERSKTRAALQPEEDK